MAKDDFFVIAYRILAYLYACMKEGGEPDMNVVSSEALKIPERYWINILENLMEDGYMVCQSKGSGTPIFCVSYSKSFVKTTIYGLPVKRVRNPHILCFL